MHEQVFTNQLPPIVLRTEGLVKKYGSKTVVNGVSFEVRAGEVVGLLGANGAGKTTSFRMTCGLIPANSGKVWLGGVDVTEWPMYRRAKEGRMGYLPQERSTFGSLTTEENLYIVAQLVGMDRATQKRRCGEMLEKFNLGKVRDTIVGNGSTGGLSGGERRRLEIARAMLTDPAIILLDEPFANVDPITLGGFQKVILELASEGIAILISDHQVDETLTITNRSYVIDTGSVLCSGTPLEVISHPGARAKYFGGSTLTPPQMMASLEARRDSLLSGKSVDPQVEPAELRTDSQVANQPQPRRSTVGSGFTVSDAPLPNDEEFVVGKPHRVGRGEKNKRSLRRDRREEAFDDFVDEADTPVSRKRRSLGLKRDD